MSNNKNKNNKNKNEDNNSNKKVIFTYGLKENSKHTNPNTDYQIPFHFHKFKKFNNSYYNLNFEKEKLKEIEEKENKTTTNTNNPTSIQNKQDEIIQNAHKQAKTKNRKLQNYLHNNNNPQTQNNNNNNNNNNNKLNSIFTLNNTYEIQLSANSQQQTTTTTSQQHKLSDNDIQLFKEKEEEILTINKIRERQNTFPSLFPHYNRFTNVHASVSLHNPFIRADHGFRFILYRFSHLKSSNIKSYNFSRNKTISHLHFDTKSSSLNRSKQSISQFLKENQFLDPNIEKLCHKELLNNNRTRKIRISPTTNTPLLTSSSSTTTTTTTTNTPSRSLKKKTTTFEGIGIKLRERKNRDTTISSTSTETEQDNEGDYSDGFYSDYNDDDEDYDPLNGRGNVDGDNDGETSSNETDNESIHSFIQMDSYGNTSLNNNNNNNKKDNSINIGFSHFDKNIQFNERMFGGSRLLYETINNDKFLILSTGPIMNVLSIYNLSSQSFPLEYNYETHSIAYYKVPQTILDISISNISSNFKIIYIRTRYSVYYFSLKYNGKIEKSKKYTNGDNTDQLIKIELLNNYTFSDRIMDVCLSKKIINQSYVLLENSSIFKLNFNLTNISKNLISIEPFEFIPPILDEKLQEQKEESGSGEEQLPCKQEQEKEQTLPYQWMRFKLNLSETQIILSYSNKIILFDLTSSKIKIRDLLISSEDEKGIINGFQLIDEYPFHIIVSTNKYLFLFDTRYTVNPLICWRNPNEYNNCKIGGGNGIVIKVIQHLIQKRDDLILILVSNSITGDISIYQYTFGTSPTSLSLPFIPILGSKGSISNSFFESPFQTLLKSDHSITNSNSSEIYQAVPCSTPFTPIISFGESNNNNNNNNSSGNTIDPTTSSSYSNGNDSNFSCNPYTSYPLIGVCLVPTIIHNLVGVTILQMGSFGDITSTVYLLQDIISREAKHEQLLDQQYRMEQVKKVEAQKFAYSKSIIKNKYKDNREISNSLIQKLEKQIKEKQQHEQQEQVDEKEELLKNEEIEEIEEIFSTTSTSISETTTVVYNLLSIDQLAFKEEKENLINFDEFSRSLEQHISIQRLNDRRNNQNYYGGSVGSNVSYTNVKTKPIPEKFKILNRKTGKPWNSIDFDSDNLGQAIIDLLEFNGPQTTNEIILALDGYFLRYEILDHLDNFSIEPSIHNEIETKNRIDGSDKSKPIFKTIIKPNYTLLNRDKINTVKPNDRNPDLENEDIEDRKDYIEFNSTVYHLDPFFSIQGLKSQPLFLKTRHRFTNKDYKSKDTVKSKYDKIFDVNSDGEQQKKEQEEEEDQLPQSVADMFKQEDIDREIELHKQLTTISPTKVKKKPKSHYKVIVRSSFYPEDWKKEWQDGYANINPNSNQIISKFSKYQTKSNTTTGGGGASNKRSNDVIQTSSSPLPFGNEFSKKQRINDLDQPFSQSTSGGGGGYNFTSSQNNRAATSSFGGFSSSFGGGGLGGLFSFQSLSQQTNLGGGDIFSQQDAPFQNEPQIGDDEEHQQNQSGEFTTHQPTSQIRQVSSDYNFFSSSSQTGAASVGSSFLGMFSQSQNNPFNNGSGAFTQTTPTTPTTPTSNTTTTTTTTTNNTTNNNSDNTSKSQSRPLQQQQSQKEKDEDAYITTSQSDYNFSQTQPTNCRAQ